MLHKLKPVPQALVIIGIVGAIGFVLMKVDFAAMMPAKKIAPETVIEASSIPITVIPPAPDRAGFTVQQAPPTPQTSVQGGLTPATNDAGLDAVLRTKK